MGLRDLFRKPAPPGDGTFLEGDELVAVVGEASYQAALQSVCGSVRWEDVACDCEARLVPEPSNRYDSNAVRVEVEGELVGYLSRGDAVDYQRVLERHGVVVCAARVAGRGPGSETSNLGVFLKLPPPD